MSKLRDARQAANLTAYGLGQAAGIREMRIYHLERGRFSPHPDEAERMARVLDQPVETLFPNLKGGTR